MRSSKSVRRNATPSTPADFGRALRELNLQWPTTDEVVQKAFRRVVAQRHPDANQGVDRGVQQAIKARETLRRGLKDTAFVRAYNERLGSERPWTDRPQARVERPWTDRTQAPRTSAATESWWASMPPEFPWIMASLPFIGIAGYAIASVLKRRGEAAVAAAPATTPTPASLASTAPCTRAVAYDNGTAAEICVVTIDGHPVERETARHYEAMRAAAQAAGVRLAINSAFRTQAEQQSLYDAFRAGRGARAARPGFSNHQTGFAIDLAVRDPAALRWVQQHAAAHGFVANVPSENWHYERAVGQGRHAYIRQHFPIVDRHRAVVVVQTQLTSLGFPTGIDGTMGPATRAAMARAQPRQTFATDDAAMEAVDRAYAAALGPRVA